MTRTRAALWQYTRGTSERSAGNVIGPVALHSAVRRVMGVRLFWSASIIPRSYIEFSCFVELLPLDHHNPKAARSFARDSDVGNARSTHPCSTGNNITGSTTLGCRSANRHSHRLWSRRHRTSNGDAKKTDNKVGSAHTRVSRSPLRESIYCGVEVISATKLHAQQKASPMSIMYHETSNAVAMTPNDQTHASHANHSSLLLFIHNPVSDNIVCCSAI